MHIPDENAKFQWEILLWSLHIEISDCAMMEILGSLRKPRRQFNGNVAKQKFEWTEQVLYTCVKFLVHFFALLCKTTTWDDQILRCLEKLNHDR